MSEDATEERPDGRDDGRLESLGFDSLSLRHRIGLVGAVALAVLPLWLAPIQLLNVAAALYFAMFAMSWDTVSGYTGQISFGHGIFFAAGGYTSTLLTQHLALDPLLSIPAGVVMAVVTGLVVGVPALRLRGPYLSLVTLVAPLILLQVFIVFSDVFGGELGLRSPESLVGFDPMANYYLAYGLFLFVLLVLLAVTRSDAGAVFTAIREDEDAVAAVGLNPAKFKTFAFVLSGAVGGLAGAVFVHTPVGSPTPSQLFTLTVNIEVIIAAILGGMGTIVGAAIGGLFLVLLRDFLSTQTFVVPFLSAPVSELSFLLFSLVALVLLFVFPGGLLRWAVALGSRAYERGRREEVAGDGGRTPAEQVLDRCRELFGGEKK